MEERQVLIGRQQAIDTEGLDAQIRCEMCRNPMHTDRGCDGHCKYDEKLYERIMQILDERITPLPSADPEPSQLAKDIAKILENDQDMRVILKNAETEPISDAYAKSVRNWLVQYQVKTAELRGRYTPYEILGWVVSDWRKDNGIW